MDPIRQYPLFLKDLFPFDVVDLFIKDIDKVHLVMVHFIQKGGWAVERNRQVHVGIIFPEELNQFGHLAFAQGLDHPEVKRLSWRFSCITTRISSN